MVKNIKQITETIKILKQGGVVVYPTDTAYGLAVDATNAEAVKKLYQLKGRNYKKPIHVIFPSTTWMRKTVRVDLPALKFMNHFLPGPLTIVLPLKTNGNSWRLLSAGTKTLGVRLPNNKIVFELLKRFKKPITTTSANLSGGKTPYSLRAVKNVFKNAKLKPDFYLDGGILKKVKPSTVVTVRNNYVKILREGPITKKQIEKILK